MRKNTPSHWIGATSLMAATALAGTLASPALAQDSSRLQAIQSEISNLQAELRRLQKQSADRDVALKRAQDDAAQARLDVQRAANQAALVPASNSLIPSGTIPVVAKVPSDPNAPIKTFQFGSVNVTLGGYLDFTGIGRSRNLTAGANTPFNAIPFNSAANAHTGEFRATAQQTRFNVLIEDNLSETTHLAGFFEADLNGAATTANSYQSNSYTPRLRLAYVQYDDNALGLHALAGQQWSLATPGIVPRAEYIPPVIDANYFPGFVYTRAPQLRVVKDFDKKVWLGLSIEAPQSAFNVATAGGASVTSGTTTLPGAGNQKVGTTVNFTNPGTSFLNSTANYSTDVAPDVVAKAAFDPGYGHYEAYGLGRWIKTHDEMAIPRGGSSKDQIAFAGGVGADATVPIIPKYLDLSGNVLAGYGVGRYGSGQLPDATFKSNGAPAPLHEIIGSVGLLGHPTKAIDLYTYLGTEQIGRKTYTSTVAGKTVSTGYGSAYANVSGCDVEAGTVATAPTCNAQTRALYDVTVGGWWKFARGTFGTVQAGVQYSYTKRTAFHGAFNTSGSVGSTPKTDENTVFVTLRYLPFY